MNDLNVRFGRSVEITRKQQGFTQAQLASALGISRPSIANIEAGKQNPPLATAIAIAEVLNLSLDSLLNSERGRSRRQEIQHEALAAARRELEARRQALLRQEQALTQELEEINQSMLHSEKDK